MDETKPPSRRQQQQIRRAAVEEARLLHFTSVLAQQAPVKP